MTQKLVLEFHVNTGYRLEMPLDAALRLFGIPLDAFQAGLSDDQYEVVADAVMKDPLSLGAKVKFDHSEIFFVDMEEE